MLPSLIRKRLTHGPEWGELGGPELGSRELCLSSSPGFISIFPTPAHGTATFNIKHLTKERISVAVSSPASILDINLKKLIQRTEFCMYPICSNTDTKEVYEA